jgi:ribosomal protein S6
LNTYDVLYILPVALTDEDLDGAMETIGGEIDRAGGRVLKTTVMGRRSFARPMGKRHEGLYVRQWLEMAPDQVSGLLGRFKLATPIFRVQFRLLKDGMPPEPVAAAPDVPEPAEVNQDG